MTDVTVDEDDQYPPDPDEDDPGIPLVRGQEIRRAAFAKKPRRRQAIKASGSRLLAREKQRRSLEMRKAGATYEAIAQAVGYADASGARKAVVKAFGEIVQEPAVELKTLQVERLNHMLLVLWPKIQSGDERAITTGLQIMDKLDRLMGTEAAQKVDVDVQHQGAILVIDGDKDGYIRQLQRMAGAIPATSTDSPAVTAALPEQTGDKGDPELGPGSPTIEHVIDAEVVETPVHTSRMNTGGFDFSVDPDEEDDK